MGSLLNFVAVTIVLFLTTGCATAIKYEHDSSLYRKDKPHNLTAVVDIFQDFRTQDEHDGTFSTTKDYCYTQDKNFSKDIGKQVSTALATHLKRSKVFKKVEVKDLPDFKESDPAIYQTLAASGADIAIYGDLHHFYGYRSGKSSATMASMFGLAGVLTEAFANKKVVGGRATIGDAKIVDVKNQKVLWQGDVDHDYDKKDTFYSEAPLYAISALKQTNDKFVRNIDEVIEKE